MPWPKRAKLYLHGCKESNWEVGEEIGLSENAIKKEFRSALYELEIELEVNEDGTYKIISCSDGSTLLLPEVKGA